MSAPQLVGAMLGQDHADRRQLRDLMAPKPPIRPMLLGGERLSTAPARLRIAIHDLIDLILGPQPAASTPMARLTASLSGLTL
jgi:hypothetical protein